MEYITKLDIIKEGKKRVTIDGITGAIEWTANAIEAEMQKTTDNLLRKISVRDRLIHQYQHFDN
jgi:hypothetical protein